MIPAVYPVVALIACLAALAAIMLAPFCRAFRNAWFAAAAAAAILYAGTKPPHPHASGDVKIELNETTASNVSITVSCPTNAINHTFQWQARRMTSFNGRQLPVWGEWETVGPESLFLSTNFTETVSGSFVNGRRDTQFRIIYDGEFLTNEVTP